MADPDDRSTPPETSYEQMLSPTQAIFEALACLGRDAPADAVRRFLAARNVDVDEDFINRVRARLPGCEPV
jgi:hypothetical protein